MSKFQAVPEVDAQKRFVELVREPYVAAWLGRASMLSNDELRSLFALAVQAQMPLANAASRRNPEIDIMSVSSALPAPSGSTPGRTRRQPAASAARFTGKCPSD